MIIYKDKLSGASLSTSAPTHLTFPQLANSNLHSQGMSFFLTLMKLKRSWTVFSSKWRARYLPTCQIHSTLPSFLCFLCSWLCCAAVSWAQLGFVKMFGLFGSGLWWVMLKSTSEPTLLQREVKMILSTQVRRGWLTSLMPLAFRCSQDGNSPSHLIGACY